MKDEITIIGGGLAGCEAAYQIAKRGIKVKLYEMKPQKFSPAHSNQNLAEIVCSNSFKSNLHTNACGLLKEELRLLDSLLIKIADETAVPAGQALAVDREAFSKRVTEELEKMDNITIVRQEVGAVQEKILNVESAENTTKQYKNTTNKLEISLKELSKDGIVIIATGPLTSDSLSKEILEITGEQDLHFYDAAAPIILKDSIDMNIAFYGNRYEQERPKDEDAEEWKRRIKAEQNQNSEDKVRSDIISNTENASLAENRYNSSNNASYINLPMNKEEYEKFWSELVNAEIVELHEFEKREIFEGCMPVEIMAKRGMDTLRYGPLKPVGFTDPRTGYRPYAVVQLRQDDKDGTIYNIVGFQTNLKFGEQKRVFSIIPGLENAEFMKYGVMHRNTFINSTKLLDNTYQLKQNQNIYFAGQITGVEGYVESISSGLVAGINAANQLIQKNIEQSKNKEHQEEHKLEQSTYKKIFSKYTMIGALANYISTPNDKFQPMNANYGILPELEGKKISDKKLKYGKISDRAIEILKNEN